MTIAETFPDTDHGEAIVNLFRAGQPVELVIAAGEDRWGYADVLALLRYQNWTVAGDGRVPPSELRTVKPALNAIQRQHLLDRLTELEEEREQIIARLRGPGACGTDRGYYRHRKTGDQPCRECLAAHAAVERRRTRKTSEG